MEKYFKDSKICVNNCGIYISHNYHYFINNISCKQVTLSLSNLIQYFYFTLAVTIQFNVNSDSYPSFLDTCLPPPQVTSGDLTAGTVTLTTPALLLKWFQPHTVLLRFLPQPQCFTKMSWLYPGQTLQESNLHSAADFKSI